MFLRDGEEKGGRTMIAFFVFLVVYLSVLLTLEFAVYLVGNYHVGLELKIRWLEGASEHPERLTALNVTGERKTLNESEMDKLVKRLKEIEIHEISKKEATKEVQKRLMAAVTLVTFGIRQW